jgi:hypothetical protein
VGSRAVLDTVVKRKIPRLGRESNPRTPIVQPVAQCYTQSDLTFFSLLLVSITVFRVPFVHLHYTADLSGDIQTMLSNNTFVLLAYWPCARLIT